MSNLSITIVGLVVLLILTVVGLLVVQVGGESIRGASLTYEIGVLGLTSETLLPGVPVTVTANADLLGRRNSSVLLLRLPTGSVTVENVKFGGPGKGTFQVTVPCGDGEQALEGAARLVLVDHDTQAVLAQSDQLRLLLPGPDCLFTQ